MSVAATRAFLPTRGEEAPAAFIATSLRRCQALEFHLRRRLCALACSEFHHWFVGAEERCRPQQARKCFERGIVDADSLDVVAPRDRDAVFSTFELRLKRQKVLVRFEIGVILADRK